MKGLVMKDMHHAYGKKEVVGGISFELKPGELICLLGPSGCGKTTLLRVAAGLERLQRGRVTLDGRIIADAGKGIDLPPEKRGIALMFQDYALFPHLTVFENIAFGISGRPAERKNWIHLGLERLGLDGMADAYPHILSGGQQQRVALLRALAPEPKVLLLDEPFSDLDVTRRAQVREETLVLLKETGVAAMIVTHEPEEAMFMADHILIMNGGRIVQAGTPAETYLHPADAFVTTLFGPVNRLEGTARNGRVSTPLGDFEAPETADGTEVEILIRPEGLLLAPVEKENREESPGSPETDGGPIATTYLARLLGRSSHVHIRCDRRRHGREVHMEARVPGVFLPADGTAVSVRVDPKQAFVFPRS